MPRNHRAIDAVDLNRAPPDRTRQRFDQMAQEKREAQQARDVVRMANLPTWARDRIENLQQRVVGLQAELTKATTGDDLPWFNSHVPAPDDFTNYIPTPHRAVRFYAGEGGKNNHHDYFDVRLGTPGNLRLEASPTLLIHAGDHIMVEPHSSNVIGVSIKR